MISCWGLISYLNWGLPNGSLGWSGNGGSTKWHGDTPGEKGLKDVMRSEKRLKEARPVEEAVAGADQSVSPHPSTVNPASQASVKSNPRSDNRDEPEPVSTRVNCLL